MSDAPPFDCRVPDRHRSLGCELGPLRPRRERMGALRSGTIAVTRVAILSSRHGNPNRGNHLCDHASLCAMQHYWNTMHILKNLVAVAGAGPEGVGGRGNQ